MFVEDKLVESVDKFVYSLISSQYTINGLVLCTLCPNVCVWNMIKFSVFLERLHQVKQLE